MLNKIRLFIFLSLAAMISIGNIYALPLFTASEIKALSIGDKVPEMVFSKMVNYSSSTAKLSDFKGKLIILDFWGIYCTSCVHNFPHLDSLQRKFRNNLQVLLVNTTEDEDKINRFFNKQKAIHGYRYQLPSVIKDSIAARLFPHEYIPHYVWINANGIVEAITSSEAITENNIQILINGGKIQTHEKQDQLNYDIYKPLFVNGNGGDGTTIQYRSMISGYIEGIGSGSGIRTTIDGDSVKRIFCTNSSILGLYKRAITKISNWPSNKIVLNVQDVTKYDYAKWDEGRFDNLYSYELITPPVPIKKGYQLMKDELDRFFNVQTNIVTKKMKCLVLKRHDPIQVSYSKGGKPENNLLDQEVRNRYIHNLSISILVETLNTQLPMPLIDETKIIGTIDMDFPINLSDIQALDFYLHKYGLELQKTEREIEVFELKDDNTQNNQDPDFK